MQLFTSLGATLNPWQVSWQTALIMIVAKEALLQIVDVGMCKFLSCFPPLPTRESGKKLYQRPIDTKDVLCLCTNSVLETIFASLVLHMCVYSPHVDRQISAMGIINGPLALWALIMCNDMFYAPMHRLLHTPLLYRWIHKHHHKVLYPSRGNSDARNELPAESFLGLSTWYMAILVVRSLLGLHAITIVVHFHIMWLASCANHAGYDLSFNKFGLDWSVRSHEMHHRRPNTNYGQLVMFWDKLMGTYVPYVGWTDK